MHTDRPRPACRAWSAIDVLVVQRAWDDVHSERRLRTNVVIEFVHSLPPPYLPLPQRHGTLYHLLASSEQCRVELVLTVRSFDHQPRPRALVVRPSPTMDSTFSTPQTEPLSMPTSPPQQSVDIDILASQAVDSLLSKQPHSQAGVMGSAVASPYMASSVDDQALMSQQYSELMAQNELLAKENRLFDSFLQRNAAAAIEQDKSPKHGRKDRNRQQLELTLSDVRARTRAHDLIIHAHCVCQRSLRSPCPAVHDRCLRLCPLCELTLALLCPSICCTAARSQSPRRR